MCHTCDTPFKSRLVLYWICSFFGVRALIFFFAWTIIIQCDFSQRRLKSKLLGGCIPTPLKHMSSSIGMIWNSQYMEKQKMFQTTDRLVNRTWLAWGNPKLASRLDSIIEVKIGDFLSSHVWWPEGTPSKKNQNVNVKSKNVENRFWWWPEKMEMF